ncbi:hypothetical protein LguiA_008169 [Lonicera macranthoides]
MSGCAKYGPVQDARQLFDEMSERMVVGGCAKCCTTITSTPDGYAKYGRVQDAFWVLELGNEVEAHRLFDMMPERNVITWNAVVTRYSKVKDLESARRCFNQMPDKRVAMWNVVLSGYAKMGLQRKL